MVPLNVAGVGPSAALARRLGREFGKSPFNKTRVARAADRIAVALPELDAPARRDLVLESYEHLANLAVEMALAPRYLNEDSWVDYIELGEIGGVIREMMTDGPVMLITGHCGNWEIVGYTLALLGFPMHALYRPLDVEPMDRFVRRTRERRGLMPLSKFGAIHELPAIMEAGGTVGFVADQNAGERGLFVPFFNRLASTYKTIGLVAQKYRAPVIVGQARRLPPTPGGPRRLHHQLDMEDIIHPEDWESQPDPLFYLTARYRRAIERMVLRSPEQYLWMHRIWKSRPRHERLDREFPPALREKLAQLPWMTDADVEALVDRSDRDREWLRDNNATRML
ncbi:MAG: lipid A biosynthesis acyltransferase [Phycisphaeraceae bacterium]|nr:MAG: lipid A biosynthesis acyltransferase [Phycisphaeraceae bacterium]